MREGEKRRERGDEVREGEMSTERGVERRGSERRRDE